MSKTSKSSAVFMNCPGIDPKDPHLHEFLDHCWHCAPWWKRIPLCPIDLFKLATSGFCKICRKYYLTQETQEKTKNIGESNQ